MTRTGQQRDDHQGNDSCIQAHHRRQAGHLRVADVQWNHQRRQRNAGRDLARHIGPTNPVQTRERLRPLLGSERTQIIGPHTSVRPGIVGDGCVDSDRHTICCPVIVSRGFHTSVKLRSFGPGPSCHKTDSSTPCHDEDCAHRAATRRTHRTAGRFANDDDFSHAPFPVGAFEPSVWTMYSIPRTWSMVLNSTSGGSRDISM